MSLDSRIAMRLAKLDALEAGGVDNWDGYEPSLANWFKENHVNECVQSTIDAINDLLVEADVEQPAGPGCGYAIHVDEAFLASLLHSLVSDATNV